MEFGLLENWEVAILIYKMGPRMPCPPHRGGQLIDTMLKLHQPAKWSQWICK